MQLSTVRSQGIETSGLGGHTQTAFDTCIRTFAIGSFIEFQLALYNQKSPMFIVLGMSLWAIVSLQDSIKIVGGTDKLDVAESLRCVAQAGKRD